MAAIETVQISAEGQVTLPQATLRKHGWDSDTRLAVIDTGGTIVLQKAGTDESEFKKWLRSVAGCAKGGLTTDEIMAMTRRED